MAAVDYNTVVQQLYVSYFGRPADTVGLTNFTTALDNLRAPTTLAALNASYGSNAGVRTLVDSFGVSAESTALYSGSTLTFVNAIYTNLLNRSPDLAGLTFWQTAIDNGSLTRGNAAASIAAAALVNTTTQGVIDAALVNNKVTVAANFTLNIDTSPEVIAYVGSTAAATARALLATVTNTTDTTAFQANVTAALANIVSGGTSTGGSTFTLTTAADNLIGTANNDTFNGVVGTSANFSAADIISGGSGVDTLSLIADASISLIGSNITSVERIQVNATSGTPVVTFSNVTGVTDVINNASGSTLTFGVAGASAGALNNVVNLTINGATAQTTVSYSDTALTGTADVMGLALTGVGTATTPQIVKISQNTSAPSANQLETLNVSANTLSNITLTTDGTQTSLKNLNITGAGNLTLGLANDNIRTSATIINASAATGNVQIGDDSGANTALGAANHSVTLGTGNDSVYFGANLNASDTVAGGAGTDTLGVSAAVTNAILGNVSGFEALRLDVGNAAGTAITQDAGITSLAAFSYAVTGAGALTLNNLANGASINVVGSTTTLTEALKDSSGLADNLTVTISNGASNAATTLTTLSNVTGLETLNLVSNGGTGTNVITTDSVTAAHVLTGSSNLTITNAIAATSFNATAFTGKLTISGSATVATNIVGGTGADVITLGTGSDSVSAGAGNDVINFGSTGVTAFGADVVAGGAGNDSFRFTATEGASANLTNYTTFATITDFTVGTSSSATDVLAFSGTDTNFGATGAAGAATGLSKGAVAAALTVGDAMVVQAVAQNASAAALTASVSLIKLSTGVAFTTDIAATAKAAIGTSTVTGLAADGVYLVSFYDTTNSKAVFVTANTGTSGAADTVLSTADFVSGTAASVHVVGVVNMTAADYALFGATNLGAAL